MTSMKWNCVHSEAATILYITYCLFNTGFQCIEFLVTCMFCNVFLLGYTMAIVKGLESTEIMWQHQLTCHLFNTSSFYSVHIYTRVTGFSVITVRCYPPWIKLINTSNIQHSSHIVLISIVGLAALDGSWFKTKPGNFSFYWDSTSGKIVVMATALRVSFCFFCDAHMWCQIPRTLLK